MATAVVRAGELVGGSETGLRVPWWSLGKTLIAATALVLVRDGAISLDDNVPGSPASLRLLLSHRSGLGDYGSLRSYRDAVAAGRRPWTPAETRRRMGRHWMVGEPGDHFHYSNIGYRLVVDHVELIAEGKFPEVATELVLAPLGIKAVNFPSDPNELQNSTDVPSGNYHPGWVLHRLVVGPMAQAACFLDRLIGGTLLPPALLGEMVAGMPVGESPADRPFLDPRYGLGTMVDGERRVVGHTGGGPGSVIAVYRRPLGAVETGFETIAAFAEGGDIGAVERIAFGLAGRDDRVGGSRHTTWPNRS